MSAFFFASDSRSVTTDSLQLFAVRPVLVFEPSEPELFLRSHGNRGDSTEKADKKVTILLLVPTHQR